ncbi:MAG: AraC family transcriptional regulator [Planctomycetota bacterium]
MPERPLYEMINDAWFQLSGQIPMAPRPFYVGRGLAYRPECDSRTNPQDPMPGHAVVKISLSHGGIGCGGANMRPVRLQPGMAVLREIGETDVWDAYDVKHNGPWEYMGLIFAGRSALATARGIAKRHGRIFSFDLNGLFVKRLLALAREPTHTVRMTGSEGMQLVQELLLHMAVNAETSIRSAPRPQLAAAVEKVISGQLSYTFSITELADMHDVSREHLTRAFKHQYGIPPAQYATQLKMREACRRLRQTDEPIKSIMNAVGFTSRATFARLFRSFAGTTPGEFRRDKNRKAPLT